MKSPLIVRARTRAAATIASLLTCLFPLASWAHPLPSAPQRVVSGIAVPSRADTAELLRLRKALAKSELRVQLADGEIEGIRAQFDETAVNVYRGIPFAAPPTGSLRWREPQAVARWAGVRETKAFGPRCMQASPFEPVFRSKQMSEDCLYLNVWTPASRSGERLPVLVYFHGGGFVSGDGSEGRYAGGHLAARGIVVVTVNYRLGVFGFFAPPEAALESPRGTAGNYGLFDQLAALRWVRDNVARFGGDPQRVTIAGNSAGSISVSAHMASPLSRGLFAQAIGQSGAAFAPLKLWTLARAQSAATHLTSRIGTASLSQLRALPADKLLAATRDKADPASLTFWPYVDGQFLPDTLESVFSNGAQAQVPLLVGSNSHEGAFDTVLGGADPTPQNWQSALQHQFGERADEALALYPGTTADEVKQSGTALASDLFVSHSTWRWMDLHRKTGRAPVYFYLYTHARPPKVDAEADTRVPGQPAPSAMGAVHSAEIEYTLANLDNRPRYAWTTQDHDIARIFSGYIERFVKTGDPNRAVTPGAWVASAVSSVVSAAVLAGGTAVGVGAAAVGTAVAAAGAAAVAAAGGEAGPRWPPVDETRAGIARQTIGSHTQTIWDGGASRQAFLQRYFADR